MNENNEFNESNGTDFDHDIDPMLVESLRRRGASAQIGGGTMSDVHRRVALRRRRMVAVVCASVALPVLAGVAVFATRHDSARVSTAAALGNDAAPPASSPTEPAPIPEYPAGSYVCATSGAASASASPESAPATTALSPTVVVRCSVDANGGPSAVPASVATGWRCSGQGTDTGDGWVAYPYCEPVCGPPIAFDPTTPTSTIVESGPSTTVDGSQATSTTVDESAVTSTSIEQPSPTSTVVVVPTVTIIAGQGATPSSMYIDVAPIPADGTAPSVVVSSASGVMCAVAAVGPEGSVGVQYPQTSVSAVPVAPPAAVPDPAPTTTSIAS